MSALGQQFQLAVGRLLAETGRFAFLDRGRGKDANTQSYGQRTSAVHGSSIPATSRGAKRVVLCS
jgi:hypothetical protein